MWYFCNQEIWSFTRCRNILIGLLMVNVFWNAVSGECLECVPADKDELRMKCQKFGADLEESESTENATIVCQFLHKMFLCVGEKVPKCLDWMYEEMESYTYTPWDCHPTDTQLLHYQVLNKNGCLETVTMEIESNLTKPNSQSSINLKPTNAASKNIAVHGLERLSLFLFFSLLWTIVRS